MFVIPPSCERYMAMQVTQYPDDPMSPERIAIQEAQGYINYLPKVPPERVIDVGCGLGRASVMLHVLYGRPATTQYWMMDSTTPDHGQLMGGWQPEGQEWCNSMSATRTFMAANGIARNRVMCCNLRSRIWPLPPGLTADIVVSTLAVGFHWTIEYWMPGCCPTATKTPS